MTELITILEEPKEETYLQLLQFALRRNSLFSLVWRDQLDFGRSAARLEEAFRPDLVKKVQTDQWPGTRLLGHLATVRIYRLSPSAFVVLAEARGLFEWIAPDRPEDLAFYTREDSPWLGSVAHEKDAFVYPESVDLKELCGDVHGLKIEYNVR